MNFKWFLQDAFSNLDRGFLFESNSRQQIVDYFNTIIEQYRHKNNVDINGQTECKLVVEAAIEFHEQCKLDNSGICLFGKYHNILYVAAKLCYQWQLQHTGTVCDLLTCIYGCEKTFEKFFECSIFGTKVPQLLSGWRSDYCTQDENFNASAYFLQHAVQGGLKFADIRNHKCTINFIDVPMHCYENLSPLKTAVKAEKWDLVMLLIRYGAITYVSGSDPKQSETYSLLHVFVQKLQKYDSMCYCKAALFKCFKIFLRSVPAISTVWRSESTDSEDTWPALSVFLEEIGLQDLSEPRRLKHLARCAARNNLACHHQLPAQYRRLCIPKVLEDYLNLETD